MNTTQTVALTCFILAVIGIAYYAGANSHQATTAEAQKQPTLRPAPTKPVVQTSSSTEVSSKAAPVAAPKSVLDGEDGELIHAAEQVLLLPETTARTSQWDALLVKATFYQRVRMTEIPAVPRIDEGRKQLRLAAIIQIGKHGELPQLISARRKFDGERFSGVLMMAWEEWARSQPEAALADWTGNGASLAAGWSDSLAKGLAKADPQEAAGAIQKLSPEHQSLIVEKLAGNKTPVK
jgi:hypothetical protein